MKRIARWLQAVFGRSALDGEMREEMRRHLDLAAARHRERGLSESDARRAARAEFGNVTYMEDEGHDARGAIWVDTIIRDVRHAARSLMANPAFTVVAVLSLAIGVGANTAIFSLIDAVMLKSLPITRPEELTLVRINDPADGDKPGSSYFTNPLWEALRDQGGAYANFAASGNTTFDLATGGRKRSVDAVWVNGDYFQALGVRPAAGRVLSTADDHRGCPGVVVASYGFWQSELGGRPDAIGKPISLGSQPFTLVGVASPGFDGIDVGQTSQLYAPICAEAYVRGRNSTLDRRSNWWLRVLARPKSGVSLAAFNARLRAGSAPMFEVTTPQNWDPKGQKEYRTQFFHAESAANGLSDVRQSYSTALWALMAMVGIILLISCANVANLLLARGTARSREIAIRIAIGASRWRLMRQFLTESVLLATGGGALGIWLALWGSRVLVAMLGSNSSRVMLDLSLDWRVLSFTAAVSVATVLLFGIAPAWRATLVDPQSAMKAGGRGNIDGGSRFRIGKALVVAQCALALVLVVGAGLLVTTFRHLATTETGFKTAGVLIADVDFKHTASHAEARRELIERVRAMPGVRATSTAEMTPVGGSSWNEEIVVDGFTPATLRDGLVWFNRVSDEYFKALSTRIIAGRDFGPQDVPGSAPVAIVNTVVVKRFFHGQSPIGKTLKTTDVGKFGPVTTIVGVVDAAKYNTLREPAQPIIYLASMQDTSAFNGSTLVVNTSGSPTALMTAITAAAAGVDPRISLSFRTLSDQVADALQRERVLAVLSGFFGALALTLAMIGLYGVMAYTVARRRVEIGIRIALGAVQGRVIQLVLGDVAMLIGVGIVLGGAGAYAATGLLKSFLFEVAPTDPTTLVVAALVLAGAALLAGAIPARRAARLEPVEALRED